MYTYFKKIEDKINKNDKRKFYLNIFKLNYRYIPIEIENNKIYYNPLSRIIFPEFDNSVFEISPKEILNLDFISINTTSKKCIFIIYYDHISTLDKPEIILLINNKKFKNLDVQKLTSEEQLEYNTGINYYKFGKVSLNYSKLNDGDYFVEFNNIFSEKTYAFTVENNNLYIKNLSNKKSGYLNNIVLSNKNKLINESILKYLEITKKKYLLLTDKNNNSISINFIKKNYSNYFISIIKNFSKHIKIPLYFCKSEDLYFKALNNFYKKSKFTDNIELFGTNIFKRYNFMIINQLMDFFRITKNMFTEINQKKNSKKKDTTYYSFESSPFSSKQENIIIFDNARKSAFDNIYIDPSSQILLDNFNKKNIAYLTLEMDYNRTHYSKFNEKRKYLDGFYLYEKKFSSNKIFLIILKFLLNKKYTNNIVFENILKVLIARKAVTYYINYFYYYTILKKLNPKSVYVVGPYKSYIYNASYDLNIQTTEIQYAAIEDNHPGFVNRTNNRDFPSKMILFNSFWINKIKHYVPESKLTITNNKYFDEGINIINSNSTIEFDLCFISQGTIGRKLAEFVYKFSTNHKDYKILFRLHPNENKKSYTILHKLSQLENITLISSKEENIYISISKSNIIIGVYSTCLFDAYFANKKIGIIKLPGWSYVKNMIENNIFHLICNNQDLLKVLDSKEQKF
jgi:hypothetical protein